MLAPVMTLPYFASNHSATLRQHWKGVSCVAAFKARLTCEDPMLRIL